VAVRAYRGTVNVMRRFFQKTWRFLVRMDVASILILVVLLLAAVGSCFPQRSLDAGRTLEEFALWKAEIQTRYGGATALLEALGVFSFYGTPLFVLSILLLTILTLFCTLDRWKVAWRRAFRRRVCCADYLFDASALSAAFVVAENIDSGDIKARLEARGLRVRLESVEGIQHYRADRNRFSHLGTLITHLGVVVLLLGAVTSAVFSWRDEVTIKPGEEASLPSAGFTLVNQGFTIERYPDGGAAGYQARIGVINSGQEITRGRLRLNQPLKVGPWAIYLKGYTQTEAGEAVTLLLVRDPGYGLVIAAGFSLLLGMTMNFNFPPCCVYLRLEPDGTLRLAGQAGRRAYGFEGEFQTLVAELEGKLSRAGSEEPGPC
jgi:cytochrome c biogenesis protein